MKWMKNEMIKAQVLLLLLVIFCSSTTYAQKQTSNSLLWEISGNGLQQPSYLFGTIHMICKEDFILSETAKQKFNSSKQVYLELDMDDPQLQMTMMQQLQLPSNESLKNKFDESDFKALDSFLMKEILCNSFSVIFVTSAIFYFFVWFVFLLSTFFFPVFGFDFGSSVPQPKQCFG
jgi:hypothetical protein